MARMDDSSCRPCSSARLIWRSLFRISRRVASFCRTSGRYQTTIPTTAASRMRNRTSLRSLSQMPRSTFIVFILNQKVPAAEAWNDRPPSLAAAPPIQGGPESKRPLCSSPGDIAKGGQLLVRAEGQAQITVRGRWTGVEHGRAAVKVRFGHDRPKTGGVAGRVAARGEPFGNDRSVG